MNAAPALSLWIAAVLVAVGVVLGGLAAWAWAPPRRRLAPLPKDWTLAARRVLSTNERRVYNQLRLAFPKYIVLPKLPLVRLCQPDTPEQVKFWYELIGAAHVTFAVCNPNGHVLLVIDLDSTRSHSRRSIRIKESVLATCGIQRLHCAADELPSIDALRSLMNDQAQDSSASEPIIAPVTAPLMSLAAPPASEAIRSPAASPDTRTEPEVTPAPAVPATPDNSTAVTAHANRPATWQDPNVFLDSFFTGDDRPGSASESESRPELVDWPPVAGSGTDADGAAVSDDEADVRWRRAPVRLVRGR